MAGTVRVCGTKVLRRYLRKMVPTENVPFCEGRRFALAKPLPKENGSAQGTFSSWLSGVETNGTGTFICGDRLNSRFKDVRFSGWDNWQLEDLNVFE